MQVWGATVVSDKPPATKGWGRWTVGVDAVGVCSETPGGPGAVGDLRSSALAVSIGEFTLANPVMPASGCFGPELSALIDVGRLGAVVTKTVFAEPRGGNPAHRLAETDGGMLNSVGIPSVGLQEFRESVLPSYLRTEAPVVVSIGGTTIDGYWGIAEELEGLGHSALELNVSCPNLDEGGLEIGIDPRAVARVTRGVVDRTTLPVFVKLTPNVSDIAEIALAASDAGARAVTVANTIVGMAIDIRTRQPRLGNVVGGFSGRAVKPIILRLVNRARTVTGLPVIGCGGIYSAEDVVEYMLAGASAVQVGTATFTDPRTMERILDSLPGLLSQLGVADIGELVGAMETGAMETVVQSVEIEEAS